MSYDDYWEPMWNEDWGSSWKDWLSHNEKCLSMRDARTEIWNYLEDVPSVEPYEQDRITDHNIEKAIASLYGADLPDTLEEIDLSEMPLDTLDGIRLPAGLTALSLGYTYLTSLAGVDFPQGLHQLDLCSTELESLDGVVLPSGLQELDLDSTELRSLDGVVLPAGLQELNLGSTNLTSLNGAVLPAGLQELNLGSTNLTSLNGVVLPAGLRELDLSNTSLKSLNGVSLPAGLQVLDLRHTKLESLEGVDLPSGLQELYLGGTPLCSLKNVTFPPELQKLDMEQTMLTDLNGVALPKSLTLLDLGYTKLQKLDGVTLPASLQILSLNNTPLSVLPEAIRELKQLELLDLSGTKLEALPDWLPELGLHFSRGANSRGIRLYRTTVKDVDMSIFRQSQKSICRWFEERKNQGETPLNEIKVVFLGNGDVGKSHTIARLLRDGKKPARSFTGKSTPGIAISDKTYPVKDQDIRVHFWDFGGQDILYSMHRMFLTERTIYVILVDARNETRGSQAREWLDTVRSFAGNAPVLLAVNKMDENPSATLDERGLMDEYPNLKKIIKMSALNADDEEFNGVFTAAMLELIQDSEWPKMKWPKNWKRVKDALQTMKEPYIRSRKYQNICRECEVETGGDSLLNWCNDLGICFCRQDERLRDYVILRPEWITNAIYTILFNKRDKVRNGLISLRDIYALLTTDESRRVLKDIPYSWQDMIYVLDVVRKFHMSYDVDRDTEFFPMLCSENSTDVVQEYATAEDTLEFHMEFEYLPNNVLHRLMVERHAELDPENVWLTGARFRQRDTGLSAVVKIDEDRLKLYVRSDNSLHAPNTYLSVIAGSIDRICHDLKLPKTKNRLIYKIGGRRAIFDYERLLKMYARNRETEYSDELDADFRILDILNQVAPAETAEQERLVADLVSLCADLQATNLYWGTSEDVRNTFLSTVLRHMPYIVLDQTRRGVSESEDSDGELDLDIRKYKDIPWTVCEALRVEGVNRVKWNGHLDKLLDNYNPNGLPFLVLLTYVDDVNERFDAIWTGFQTHIQTYNSGAFQVDQDSFKLYTTEDWAQKHYIKTARCQYVRGSYRPTVYHIFVRMGR